MPQIDAAAMKKHLIIDPTFTDHDQLIDGFIAAAEAMFVKYLRRDLDTEFPSGWEAPLVQALKLQVAQMYAQRGFEEESGTEDGMSKMVRDWLSVYRSFA